MKPQIYVTQIPNRRDKETHQLVPSVNISPATEHGEINVLMPPDANFFLTGDLISQLRESLADYNFDRGDAIIALGDPVIIAVVGALLGERTRQFNVLRWDKNIGRYSKIKVAL